MNGIKKDFLAPLAVLSAICLIVSGALAATNRLTSPVIEQAAAERAGEIKRMIFPGTDDFILIEADGLPRTVTDVYEAANGAGYIFIIRTLGYGGDIDIICGIDMDGRIIRTETLKETETRGFVERVLALEPLYMGKDRNLEGIDAVSGATITFNAYKNGILDAFEAYELVREGRQ